MPDRQPNETKNLDTYERPPLSWARAHDLLEIGTTGPRSGFFLATVDANGPPHVAGVGVIWHDGDLYFTSGSDTRKARNLKATPACSLAVNLPGMDLTLEGEATIVTDSATLETAASTYRELGWPARVEGNAFAAPYSAPSAGPPPWDLYRFTYSRVVGMGTAEPGGATLWQFGDV
jgi:Pyridoxamine 5'-phosphate oxidase